MVLSPSFDNTRPQSCFGSTSVATIGGRLLRDIDRMGMKSLIRLKEITNVTNWVRFPSKRGSSPVSILWYACPRDIIAVHLFVWTSEKYQHDSPEIFSLESLLKCRISSNFLGNFCWLFHIMQLKLTFPLCAVLATWLSRAFLFSFGWEVYIYI